mmetsp:Transcript_23330/g.73073  ORF Transcript_23330/g.73073 Transcript_23330/m.73073 type:complete len:581 (+) Transcript_23330:23-1765(+)
MMMMMMMMSWQVSWVGSKSGMASALTPPRSATGVSPAPPSAVMTETVAPWSLEGSGVFCPKEWAATYRSVSSAAIGEYECEVEGRVPASLRGTLFRCSPAKFERGGKRYKHVLDGDGFVFGLELSGEGARYRGRFVETEYYLEEEAAGAVRYRNTFGTQRDGGAMANALDVKLKNVANTNCVHYADSLWALWEGGRPYALDPKTLEVRHDAVGLEWTEGETPGVTLGAGGWLDRLAGVGEAHTAHPHVAGDRLVTLTWAQNPLLGDLRLKFREFELETRESAAVVDYAVPDCALAPHDFAVTPAHYAFVENRLTFDVVPFIAGAKCPGETLVHDLGAPARLHVVDRSGRGDHFALDLGAFFCIHVGFALQTEDTLRVYSSGWDLNDARYFPDDVDLHPFLGSWGGDAPDFDLVPPALLFETVIDLKHRRLLSHASLDPRVNVEHPKTNPDLEGAADAPFCYSTASNVIGDSSAPVGWATFDLSQRRFSDFYWAPPSVFCEELVVVPKSPPSPGDASPPAEADDRAGVWLLGLMHDIAGERTSLAVLDGADLRAGPVCRVHLPAPIAFGLHGTFVPAEDSD